VCLEDRQGEWFVCLDNRPGGVVWSVWTTGRVEWVGVFRRQVVGGGLECLEDRQGGVGWKS